MTEWVSEVLPGPDRQHDRLLVSDCEHRAGVLGVGGRAVARARSHRQLVWVKGSLSVVNVHVEIHRLRSKQWCMVECEVECVVEYMVEFAYKAYNEGTIYNANIQQVLGQK